MTFVGEGGADGGSVYGTGDDVSVGGCEAGSVVDCKDGGCGLNVCDGEDGGEGCCDGEGEGGANGCCGGVGKVEWLIWILNLMLSVKNGLIDVKTIVILELLLWLKIKFLVLKFKMKAVS